MKTRFTRTQINFLLVLAALTVALTVGIFFLPWVGPVYAGPGPTPPNGPPVGGPPPHNINRNPRVANHRYLDWEINIGGSGNDEVVGAWRLINEIIIFGNTTSNDYDFYGFSGGFFVSLLSLDGRPISHFVYPGRLERVFIINEVDARTVPHRHLQGFMLLVNTDTESLIILTNDFGMEQDRLNVRRNPHERIVDMYFDDFAENRVLSGMPLELFHAVIEHTSPIDGFKDFRVDVIYYNFSERRLGVSYYHFFRRAHSLEFVRGFATPSEFVLFATARGHIESLLTVYRWSRHSITENSFINIHLPQIGHFSVDEVASNPIRDSFIALVRNTSNVVYLVEFYSDFANPPIFTPSNVPVSHVQMLGGRHNLYVFENQIGDRGHLVRYNKESMQRIDTIPLNAFNNFVRFDTHYVTHFGTVFVGATPTALTIIGTNPQGVVSSWQFNSTSERIVQLIYTPNGLIMVGESSGESNIAGGNFGGIDVWVSKLVF